MIFHSDRGSQYTSDDFQSVLGKYGITSSMSRLGNCWDNVCSQTLFGSLKVERLHSTLDYVSPIQFKENWLASRTLQASA